MKLYQLFDGTLVGFYREEGFELKVTQYEDIYEQQLVTKFREEEIVIPGHYEMQPFWFEEYYITKYYWREAHPARGLEAAWIPYQELVPAGYSITRVWVDEKIELETISYKELEDVWVGQRPIYEAVDPSEATMFRVVDIEPAPEEVTYAEDIVTVENVYTGEELTTTAVYLGMATRIDDNEFVVP